MTWSGPADFLGWAKRPQSDLAVRVIMSLAPVDRRFAAIAGTLIKEGVATRSGRLLIRPDGQPASRGG